MKKLSDDQVEAFDTDFVEGRRWNVIEDAIATRFPDGKFSLLDVGGGNGRFADKILEQFPHASACVVDNSSLLLSRNTPHPRKETLLGSTETLLEIGRKFDVICMHWVLHHLVGNNYAETRKYQREAISNSMKLLADRGWISVFENNVSGWLIDSAPGWMIFQISAAKSIAALTRKLGANTGGIGVCYLTRKQWTSTFEESGLNLDNYVEPDEWKWQIPISQKVLLTLKQIRVAHYLLAIKPRSEIRN